MSIRKLYYKFCIHSLLCQDKTFRTRTKSNRVFVFLAGDYGNLGDVAITYAQEHILNVYYHGYEVVDVPISRTLALLRPIKEIITPSDIITITGGGNMGKMYGDIELLRLMVIRAFPNNKIVVFPQTSDYECEKGYLFSLAKKTYNKHNDVTLLAREDVTFSKMSKFFSSAKRFLVPDVVMTLDLWKNNERKGILFCLRNDKEKSSFAEKTDEVVERAKSLGMPIFYYDTHIEKSHMSLDVRNEELHEIWDKFSNAKLVVTDRLHGMIFAYITGTPAIVIPNNNFKVEKCYEWIANCGYIFFCKDTIFDLKEVINIIPNRSIFEQNNKRFKKMIFDAL